jgi:hypothetical protein
MTTNVLDIRGGMAATDSRWSYTLKDGDRFIGIVYADNTGFDKVVIGEGACAMFAGCSKLISQWKHWISSPHKVVLRRPHVQEGFSMCVINAKAGTIVFEHGQKISDDAYRFAGTGAIPAHECWLTHRDAIKAVGSAAVKDQYSGGEVKYLKVKSQEHNVIPDGKFEAINEAIIERGIVMYQAYEGKKVSIQDAAETDEQVRALMNRIATGEASAQAPGGHDPVVWTESDVKRLDDALHNFFGPIAK